MDAREEDWDLPATVPVRPKSLGRGLPVPPVIPFVAVIGVFIGLAMGYRIAAGPQPSAAPPPPRATAPPALATDPLAGSRDQAYVPIVGPIGVADPPADGLTIDELMGVLAGPWMRIPPSDVLSARVARYNEVSNTRTGSTQWVWVLVLKDHSAAAANGDECLPAPSSGAAPARDCAGIEHTQIMILDYETGGFLEAQSWPRT